MSKLNLKILESIKKNCSDKQTVDFIKDLLLIEAERSGNWWWKEKYREKINEYLESGGQEG